MRDTEHFNVATSRPYFLDTNAPLKVVLWFALNEESARDGSKAISGFLSVLKSSRA